MMDYTAVAMCGELSELIHKLNSVTGSQLLVEQRKFRDWVKAANELVGVQRNKSRSYFLSRPNELLYFR